MTFYVEKLYLITKDSYKSLTNIKNMSYPFVHLSHLSSQGLNKDLKTLVSSFIHFFNLLKATLQMCVGSQ